MLWNKLSHHVHNRGHINSKQCLHVLCFQDRFFFPTLHFKWEKKIYTQINQGKDCLLVYVQLSERSSASESVGLGRCSFTKENTRTVLRQQQITFAIFCSDTAEWPWKQINVRCEELGSWYPVCNVLWYTACAGHSAAFWGTLALMLPESDSFPPKRILEISQQCSQSSQGICGCWERAGSIHISPAFSNRLEEEVYGSIIL